MPTTRTRRTKTSAERTLADHLSHLKLRQAEKLLGAEGKRLLREGGKLDIESPADEVRLEPDAFVLDHAATGAQVTIRLSDARRGRLALECSHCGREPCEHKGAALAFVLEEKTLLGLAEPPPERVPVESLDEDDLVARAIAEREERAATEKMRVKSVDPDTPWTDYMVTNKASGKTYRVALRGWEPGRIYCSCPDFRKNTLGLCKHTLQVSRKVRRRFPKEVCQTPWVPDRFTVSVTYGKDLSLRLEGPDRGRKKAAAMTRPFLGKETSSPSRMHRLLKTVRELERLGEQVTIFPDAEEFIARELDREGVVRRMEAIREDPANHPLRTSLLKVPLLPYQLDGIAFAAGAGRAILADDMGLGKTIQGIGVAEILARQAGISRVLVVCPASLKSQWAAEIAKFGGRDSQVILGPGSERAGQYRSGAFFTICNYEQVLRDQAIIEPVPWDLIILDEGQRIKNWEAKTSNVIKSLRSPYALVLSGTPLENRLDELFSVVEFIDDRRLGAAFRFYNRHRMVDERGKVLGYKNLAELRERLKPVLLRRTRASVLQELPPRTTEVVRIAPTGEQKDINDEQLRTVAQIAAKRYITEMDMMRMQKALLMARMAADSSFLVHKEAPGFSSKLERLDELLEGLSGEEDRKIVLFSEWTTMLDLIEPLLTKHAMNFVRLEGKVPQRKRQQLVSEFRDDPKCRVFLATNAGSTGLNLQAANTVINVDLPWNPAVLEQRIARAHRMGQKRPVQVYVLVTEGTIEENLLETLSAKHELAQAALDPDSDIDEIALSSGMEELKGRLEVLLGNAPESPVDESVRQSVEQESMAIAARREKVAAAGGHLLSAAFGFLSEVMPASQADQEAQQAAIGAVRERLRDCLEEGEDGETKLTVTLPDSAAVDRLAEALGRLLAR